MLRLAARGRPGELTMTGDTRWTMTALLPVGFLLLISAGCARSGSDWIEATLVTVDVTGVWRGSLSRAGGASDYGSIELTLQQEGPKVTGQVRLSSLSAARNTRVEGTVSGDVFRFQTPDGRRTGELQVNGDRMSGSGMAGTLRVSYDLSRQP
jgi:hypothetical protein